MQLKKKPHLPFSPSRDGSGLDFNGDPPRSAPIRDRFGSVLVGFGLGMIFHRPTKAGIGCVQPAPPHMSALYTLLSKNSNINLSLV